MFKILRFDHMHMKPTDFDRFNENFQNFLGFEYFKKDDMSEKYGTKVAYEPAPIGLEAFQETDPGKSLSARIAENAEGIFCICYKVDDLKAAICDMEAKG